MPIEKVGKKKADKYKVRRESEREKIDKALDRYRNDGHNVYEFVRDFLGVYSSKPCIYLNNIKVGKTSISLQNWEKIADYASKPSGK